MPASAWALDSLSFLARLSITHRFGFRSAELFGLENEYGASEEFMALELKTGSITPGLARYASEFSDLASVL